MTLCLPANTQDSFAGTSESFLLMASHNRIQEISEIFRSLKKNKKEEAKLVPLQQHVKYGQLFTSFLPCAYLLPGLQATSISSVSLITTAATAFLKFLHRRPPLLQPLGAARPKSSCSHRLWWHMESCLQWPSVVYFFLCYCVVPLSASTNGW